MGGIDLVLLVLAILIISEGVFISLNPETTRRLMKELSKDLEKLKNFGLVELFAGILILFYALFTSV